MINDYHMLSGLQKVAILFSVVGESLAMSLIKGLSKTEVRKIRSTVRSMGTVSFLVKIVKISLLTTISSVLVVSEF